MKLIPMIAETKAQMKASRSIPFNSRWKARIIIPPPVVPIVPLSIKPAVKKNF